MEAGCFAPPTPTLMKKPHVLMKSVSIYHIYRIEFCFCLQSCSACSLPLKEKGKVGLRNLTHFLIFMALLRYLFVFIDFLCYYLIFYFRLIFLTFYSLDLCIKIHCYSKTSKNFFFNILSRISFFDAYNHIKFYNIFKNCLNIFEYLI